MRFCPRCGKQGIKGDFCSECSKEELQLGFKDITIKKCIDCDRFKVRDQWLSFRSVDEGIVRAVHPKIKNPRKVFLDIVPHYDPLKDKPGAKQDIELEISADHQEFIIPAVIEFTYCPKCSKAGSQYFEGTLQIREATPELLDFVRRDIAKHAKDGVHVTKESGKGKNLDLRLTSAKYLRVIGKKLKQKFNGELTETSKLFSRNKQTSKEIHRTTVLFKMRNYKIGDVVKSRGRKVKIKTIGKRVSGVDIETGKKVFVE
ncbi:hypothetical protein KY349_03855 [Candidatus Woesearchaeota archaeon]|nr:hypothetical protein [Candidatus Woesearchaeota archaeon]